MALERKIHVRWDGKKHPEVETPDLRKFFTAIGPIIDLDRKTNSKKGPLPFCSVTFKAREAVDAALAIEDPKLPDGTSLEITQEKNAKEVRANAEKRKWEEEVEKETLRKLREDEMEKKKKLEEKFKGKPATVFASWRDADPKLEVKVLKDHFSQYGPLVSLEKPKVSEDNYLPPYCVVTFMSPVAADDALRSQASLKGVNLKVALQMPGEDPEKRRKAEEKKREQELLKEEADRELQKALLVEAEYQAELERKDAVSRVAEQKQRVKSSFERKEEKWERFAQLNPRYALHGACPDKYKEGESKSLDNDWSGWEGYDGFDGYDKGFAEGLAKGLAAARAKLAAKGRADGFAKGFAQALEQGVDEGYDNDGGYDAGDFDDAYEDGGFAEGYGDDGGFSAGHIIEKPPMLRRPEPDPIPYHLEPLLRPRPIILPGMLLPRPPPLGFRPPPPGSRPPPLLGALPPRPMRPPPTYARLPRPRIPY